MSKNTSLDMTEGKVAPCLIQFAIPLLLGNILQQLYLFLDTMIVGKYIGVTGLAALGATEWMIFMMINGAQGITHGFSIDIAQLIGKKERKGVKESINHSIVLCTLIALCISILGILACNNILLMLKTPVDVIVQARNYVTIILGGLIITIFYNMVAAILRAEGDSVTPFIALVISSIINVALDYFFVAIFQFGVQGAAFATLIAQLVSLMLCIDRIRKKNIYTITKDIVSIDVHKIIYLLKLGLPLGMQNVIIGVGGIIVQSQINSFGTVFIASYTAANKLYALLESAAGALGSAVATFTGQNYGANNKKRILEGIKVAVLLSIAISMLMSLIMLIGGKLILACFVPNHEAMKELIIQTGYQFLLILSMFFSLLYILYALYALVQGMGHSFLSMLSSCAQLVMRVICALILTKYIGYYGFFWGEIFAWLGSDLILCASVFYGLGKMERVCYESK